MHCKNGEALALSNRHPEPTMKLSLRSPCPIRPTLTGVGDTTSACALCKKHVHHLSRMTEAEGRATLERAKTEDTCVRYVADTCGNVIFAPKLRRVAAAGLLAFAPVAFADGGEGVAQAHAEMNRVQNEMNEVGMDPTRVIVDATANASNAHQHASKTAGTEPRLEPEVMVMWDGGI
ncbi:MAG: hypothetical protein ACJAZO_005052 [Myxococcota bacterium]